MFTLKKKEKQRSEMQKRDLCEWPEIGWSV